jgi:hypothetical protein
VSWRPGAYVSGVLYRANYSGSLDRFDLPAFAARVRAFTNRVTGDTLPRSLTGNSLHP